MEDTSATTCSTGPQDRFDFPNEEERILEFWDSIGAFERSLELSKDRPVFNFFDGPPFATGLPHYGHLLAGSIKDTVLRYAHLNGFHVERKFGWDCHGLPVEYEIDKKLDIKGREDVERIGGIAAYNKECREIVMRYSGEWEKTVRRSARWIDFKNDYKTMYPSFMESTWWVFQKLFKSGQIYRGFRVMPYSTACCTPLSNFEVALNYKDVQDPSITVMLPLKPKEEQPLQDLQDNCFIGLCDQNQIPLNDICILIWTTTPWTMPSNLAVCVHPEMIYCVIEQQAKLYLVGEDRLIEVFKVKKDKDVDANADSNAKIIFKVTGKQLEFLRYTAPFSFFTDRPAERTHSVLCDTYVTSDTGTGLVHQAPGHGDEDFAVCMRYGVISEDGGKDVPLEIGDSGNFEPAIAEKIAELAGRPFKEEEKKVLFWRDANPMVIKALERAGLLFEKGQLMHSIAHCWRSDTPLINRAIPCWFVRVKNIVPRILEETKKTNWVPSQVKEGRWANWISNAHDWAISRNRYWGTPIPLWASEDYSEIVSVGSIEELERLSSSPPGSLGGDIHRDSIDHITIPSPTRPDGPPLKRVPEVLDCWFESGSVPYASKHYPFEADQAAFEKAFPADFIAEGIDQTRGWFYTLAIIGIHLFDCIPFKNVIVNGLVLASDGKKMSKRLKNYPEPTIILDKYGADALRIYLINSPVVRAESLKFKEEGVKMVVKDVLLPWWNAYRFLQTQLDSTVQWKYAGDDHVFKAPLSNGALEESHNNVMDQWILASLHTLTHQVKAEMKEYRLYTVVPPLLCFIESLTNWYIRFNRRRLRSCSESLSVLFGVVLHFSKLMAPFAPLLSENIYQRLLPYLDVDGESCGVDSASCVDSTNNINNNKDIRSVHFLPYPTVREELRSAEIESAFLSLQTVILQGRTMREANVLPLKTPLECLTILLTSRLEGPKIVKEIQSLMPYLKEELNVRRVEFSYDEQKWGVKWKPLLNFKLLGRKLRKDLQRVQMAFEDGCTVTQQQLKDFSCGGLDATLKVLEFTLEKEDLSVVPQGGGCNGNGGSSSSSEKSEEWAISCCDSFILFLSLEQDSSLKQEGLARELINKVQRMRKKFGLRITDNVDLFLSEFSSENTWVEGNALVEESLKCKIYLNDPTPENRHHLVGQEMVELSGNGGEVFKISLLKLDN